MHFKYNSVAIKTDVNRIKLYIYIYRGIFISNVEYNYSP